MFPSGLLIKILGVRRLFETCYTLRPFYSLLLFVFVLSEEEYKLWSPTTWSCLQLSISTDVFLSLYVCNKSYTPHRLQHPLRDVIHERINKHHNKLEAHPNPPLEPLLQRVNTRRLKRCWPLDFQGTWVDIAGCIPYHVIVTLVHGIVVYFV